ncbi:MAG: carbohydrate kinase family protein, partial [Candidatus Hodarchaeota archaeon]
HLQNMVKIDVLGEEMERVEREEKAVWLKYYQPTIMGEYLSLLLSRKSEEPEKMRRIIKELFKIYAEKVVSLGRSYGVTPSEFEEIIRRSLNKLGADRDVIVFGSIALDTVGMLDAFPEADETVLIDDPLYLPGGSAANVANTIAKLGLSVSLIGKAGGDPAGKRLLAALQGSGVDTQNIIIDSRNTTIQTFITIAKGNKRIFVLKGPDTALSISPSEVNWEQIKKSKSVYIGETFLEVAEKAAELGYSLKKLVVYRPAHPQLKTGIDSLKRVLKNTDVFIINSEGWRILKENSELQNPSHILTLGGKYVIVTKGARGVSIYHEGGETNIPAPEVKAIDPTGAGDVFSATLIKYMLDGKAIEEASVYASAASAISIQKVGAQTHPPSVEEIENFAVKRGAG